jgi:hypothetical protein
MKGQKGERKCTVQGCDSRHYATDLCKKHYAQVLRHGKLTPERERGAIRVCPAPQCGRTDTVHGYCRKHFRQIRVHGRLTPEREHIMGYQGCKVPRCKDPHRSKGFCTKHYNRERWRALKTRRATAAPRGRDRARSKAS